MTKFIRYLKPYWYFALLAPSMMALEVITELRLPLLMKEIVNKGIGQNQSELIRQNGLEMMIIVLIGALCGLLSVFFSTRAAQGFANDLRKDAFSRVVHLSFEQTDKFTIGSLVTRLTNDIEHLRILVSQSTRMFVRAIMLFGGGIIMMLSIDSSFSLILFIVLPIEVTLIFIFLKKAFPLFTIVQSSLDDVNAVMQENVSGARVVKAYVREAYEAKRFGVTNDALTNNSLRVSRIMAFIGPAMTLFLNITTIFILYWGGSKAIEGSGLQVGDVMAALNYIGMILMSVMMVAMIFQSITRAKASGARVKEVMNAIPSVKSGTVDASKYNGDIIFANVSFRYPSTGKPVLKNINLEIKKGEMLAVLGATGSGKTTLVNLIPRFYDVTDGAIFIGRENIQNFELTSLRKLFGMVPQKTELFSGSIIDNIRWGKPDATLEEVIEVCKVAQAHDFISSFKDGYDTIIGEKGSSLSGGQKQRIAIARAIIARPRYLIFDDSTSALDLSTEARLYRALSSFLHDTTVILIAQRVVSAKRAQRIAIIDNGSLVACDTHTNLLKTNAIYQDIYYSQLKDEG